MELGDVAGNTPVALADPHDIRVLLALFLDIEKTKGKSSIALDPDAVAPLLNPSSNHLAAFLRTAILFSLVREGRLDDLRSEADLSDAVLKKAATYPLPGGIDQFKPEDFIAFLRFDGVR